ncbi:hypothetical protein SynA18461_00381 [Synechococcus sp. A18-46.1]|nr:hypothetical protein SynA18461_00381 [Synechococcus sp. A18-46.1]
MGLIREKLSVTEASSIALNFLVMNLEKLLKLLFVFLRTASASPQQSTREAVAIGVSGYLAQHE